MKPKIILGGINIIFGLLFFPSLVIAGLGVMMFDTPGSQNSLLTRCMFWSVASFPLLCIVSFILPWIFYKKEKFLLAYFSSVLPLLSVLATFVSGVALQVFCQGSFACS